MAQERLELLVTTKGVKETAADIRSVGTAAQQTNKSLKDVQSTTDNLAVALAGGLGAKAALQGVMSLATAAGQLTNQIATAKQVFGEGFASIEEGAMGAVAAVGLSKRGFIEATTYIGGLGKAAGLAGQELADFSTSMVEVAADLAAAFNTSVEDAVKAIQSGFSGSSIEPLRRYNIVINDTALKAEYLRLTGIKVNEVLSFQQRQLAFVSLLMKQTADYQGQWGRESDQFLGTQQRLTAEFENFQAVLGEGVVPGMTGLMNVAIGVLSVFNEMPEPMQEMIGLFVGVSGAVVAGKLALVGFNRVLTQTGASQRVLAAATTAGNVALVAGGAALGLYSLGALKAANNLEEFERIASRLASFDFTGYTLQQFNELRRVTDRGILENAADGVEDLLGALLGADERPDRMEDAVKTFDELIEKAPAAALRLRDAAAADDVLRTSLESSGLTLDYMSTALDNYRRNTQDASSAQDDLNEFVEGGVTQAQRTAEAVAEAGDVWDAYADALGKVTDAAAGAEEAISDALERASEEFVSDFDPYIAVLETNKLLLERVEIQKEVNDGELTALEHAEAEIALVENMRDVREQIVGIVDSQIASLEDVNGKELTSQERLAETKRILDELATSRPELLPDIEAWKAELEQQAPVISVAAELIGNLEGDVTAIIDQLGSRNILIDLLVQQGNAPEDAARIVDSIPAEKQVDIILDAQQVATEKGKVDDEEFTTDLIVNAVMDTAQTTLDDFTGGDWTTYVKTFATVDQAYTTIQTFRNQQARTPIIIPVRVAPIGMAVPSGSNDGPRSVPGVAATAAPSATVAATPMYAPSQVIRYLPVSNTYVTINPPPGTNPDEVVRSIRTWQRRNGSVGDLVR
jgi:hypothetical protein